MAKSLALLAIVGIVAISFLFLSLNLPGSTPILNSSPAVTSTNLELLQAQELQVPANLRERAFVNPRELKLPRGFSIAVFAGGMVGVRGIEVTPEGIVVTDKTAGRLYLLPDNNRDLVADENIIIDQGLINPHGVAYFEGDLYVAEEHQVVVYNELQPTGKYSSKQTVIANLPRGGHVTRTILIGSDRKIYLSIGSSCNVCEESDVRRASVMRYNLDGTGSEVFSLGLRNSVGLFFRETGPTTELWSVDNGRDQIGDDIPPEEVNILTFGAHYGWPFCYGNQIANPEYPSKVDFCKTETSLPKYNMQAHSAPLGLSFTTKKAGDTLTGWEGAEHHLFITFHGSWNRSQPTGYKVVSINTANSSATAQDFITGWDTPTVWGRPVDIEFDSLGHMFITDDEAGAVYVVSRLGN